MADAREELGSLARKAVPRRADDFYQTITNMLLQSGVDSQNLLQQLDREQLAGFLGDLPLANAIAGALLKVARDQTGLLLQCKTACMSSY